MNVVFHPAAQKEAHKATAHYSEVHKQLGSDFRLELEAAVSRILQAPTAWNPIKKDYRRCILPRIIHEEIYL